MKFRCDSLSTFLLFSKNLIQSLIENLFEQEMNETKSKALLIVSLIAILVVSTSTVVLHTLYPPEHEILEVLRVDWTGEPNQQLSGSNVWLGWYGQETELGIYVQEYFIWGYGQNRMFLDDHWWCNLTVSYGRVFNVSLPHLFWAQLYYDDVELTLGKNGVLQNGTIYPPRR